MKPTSWVSPMAVGQGGTRTRLSRRFVRRSRANTLDADIRGFYDSIDHEGLPRMLENRIADPRVLRLIRMWLEAGILESDEWHETDKGTPRGACISPLLANIVLHYALDLWVHQWRRRYARGRVSIVRYADDFVMGFERVADARRMMAELKKRLARFSLALHEGKTRPIELGRLPAMARRQRGGRRRLHSPSSGSPMTADGPETADLS